MAPWPAVSRGWESLLAADRGEGAPVLLVHGQPGSAADWDRVVGALGAGPRLVVVDRPGYGSSTVAARSMAENAKLLADLLVGRAATPAVVVGHSYGGGVALLMAARRPEVVAGLVLVGSVGSAGSVNSFDHVLALPGLGDALSAAGLFALGRVLGRLARSDRSGRLGRLPNGLAARLWANLPDERYAASLSRAGVRLWRSFVAEQRALLVEIADLELAAGQVSVPTSVVTGTLDVVVPPSAAAALAATVPGAELVLLPGVGHLAGRDAPGAVAAAVRRVLGRALTR
jgi:pimeloyl-ACP methyl ester carboxylesterase